MTKGACRSGTGLSQAEPVPVSSVPASIPSALLALAERCEAAEGPDRELDELISAAIQDAVREVQGDGRTAYHSLDGRVWVAIAVGSYTASLDAALTLVPEGWLWSVDNDAVKGAEAMVWRKVTEDFACKATTPALALCAAALKARHAQGTEAGTAETAGLGPKDDGPVGPADAPNPAPNPRGSTQEREG